MPRRLALAAFFAAAAIACSAPPDKELRQAEGALATARAAGASTYAPEELKAAETALAQYNAAVEQHDYRQALRLATEARDSAYDATKRAGDEKAAARAAAERLIADLEARHRAATARLSGSVGPRVPPAAAERLRPFLRTSASALQKARTDLEQQRYQAIVMALTPIVERFAREFEPPTVPSARRGR